MKYKLKLGSELKDETSVASVEAVPVSLKKSVELSRFLKGRKLNEALDLLEKIMKKKVAVPFRKYKSVAHKRGIGPGKYPINAASYFLKLLKNASANAMNKGLSDDLLIYHISADKGPTQPRYGRKRGIHAKRTHLQVVLKEIKTIKGNRSHKQVINENGKTKLNKKLELVQKSKEDLKKGHNFEIKKTNKKTDAVKTEPTKNKSNIKLDKKPLQNQIPENKNNLKNQINNDHLKNNKVKSSKNSIKSQKNISKDKKVGSDFNTENKNNSNKNNNSTDKKR